MLPEWLIVLTSAAYLALLFAVARYGDARADSGRSIITANVYALSIAVYCTTWTFYGSVGRAAGTGLLFLPVYLGPTLIFLFSTVVLKMVRISKTQRITSIADFIASRYGKSQFLAGLVTVIAVIGVIPYIALQLKAVSASLEIMFARPSPQLYPWLPDSTLLITLVMVVFTILFGTRHLDTTERHEGMVAAIAFESLVKLVAFVAVGLFVTYGLFNGFGDLFQQARMLPELEQLLTLDPIRAVSWAPVLVLSAFAVIFLPRQFQIIVVENVSEAHLKRAVWMFPAYLLLINLFVLPLALGGALYFMGGQVDADTFVLTLPAAQGGMWLTLLAFVGGLSAATGMLIVETIALSTMVCNDLVMPFLLRRRRLAEATHGDLSGLLLMIRRVAIALILLLGYAYFRLAGEAYALVAIGLISFAAVAQFAPAIFGGMYWKQGTRNGAIAGLVGGFLVWLYTLLLPSFAKSGWIATGFMEVGPFGIEWLKAQALFGMRGLDEISHSMFWSLLVNVGLYIGVSVFSRQTALEAGQAERFVDALRWQGRAAVTPLWRGNASPEAIVKLLERFLGWQRAHRMLTAYARHRGLADWHELKADGDFVQFAEIRLAGAIGSASARVMISSVVEEEPLKLDEVLDILDEASQLRAYSKELERKSRELERATADLRTANARLRELDKAKDNFISTTSHELRTPLTSIRAFSEMLFEDPEMDLDSRRKFLGIIVTETERLTRLINQILDMAKLQSGEVDWVAGTVAVNDVIDEAVNAMDGLARERQVRVMVDLPETSPSVLVDRDRLMQVLLNLLSNALKFVPEGAGLVRVRAERDGDEVFFTVEDNGLGIAHGEEELVFEKFRQGGNSLTDKPKGTGLGLPISREIVQYFGGRLWVESAATEDGLGGARFVFSLPVAPH